jgi:hypothetical protein
MLNQLILFSQITFYKYIYPKKKDFIRIICESLNSSDSILLGYLHIALINAITITFDRFRIEECQTGCNSGIVLQEANV